MLLKDGVKLLESIGYSYEGIDYGVKIYYHPNNPRQCILLIPCRYEPDDELSEELSIKIYEAASRASKIKH